MIGKKKESFLIGQSTQIEIETNRCATVEMIIILLVIILVIGQTAGKKNKQELKENQQEREREREEDFNTYSYSKDDNIFSQGYIHTDNKD